MGSPPPKSDNMTTAGSHGCGSTTPLDIPIVDLAPFTTTIKDDEGSHTNSPESRLRAAQALVTACRSVGFVYIQNHGVPQKDLEDAFELARRFYALPQEDKMKAPHPPGWQVHRGYSWPGLEKVSDALSTTAEGDNDDKVTKLREVQDYKVGRSVRYHYRVHTDSPSLSHTKRRVTKSAPSPIKNSPTCGHLLRSCKNGVRS